ncbi:MAG: hypothetical protein KatS3mg113_0803 [Planctomycetaceae bacterium]|nr:MAG: hypothetical protein KatS3mg113_0803 [Planctomycetaceae bacterium]
MTVPCVKTSKLTGEPYRVVPLFPELREGLAELFDQAPDGSRYVIQRYRSAEQNLRTQFQRVCLRAGIAPFPKPFIAMRASRATELADEYPSHVCTAWLGHSEQIAIRHYRQVTEEHFKRAAQKAAQQEAESSC